MEYLQQVTGDLIRLPNTEEEPIQGSKPRSPDEEMNDLLGQANCGEISPEEKDRLFTFSKEYWQLFDTTTVGSVDGIQYAIDVVGNTRPIRCPPYRALPGIKARTEIEKQVKYLQDQNLVRPSQSPWAFPVVLAKKPNGKWRFCADYRRLNAVTITDTYPIPRIDDAIDSLSKAWYFSTMDTEESFWQVPLDETDAIKTAFITHVGIYGWIRMPMGLKNSPVTFQRLMDVVL